MAEAQYDEQDLQLFQRLKDDFVHYAPRCLVIRTKEHGLQPFELNDAQLYLHGSSYLRADSKGLQPISRDDIIGR